MLTGKAPQPSGVPAPREEAVGLTAAAAPGVYTAPPQPVPAAGSEFVKGAVFGAVVALAGVLVGGWVTRRRG